MTRPIPVAPHANRDPQRHESGTGAGEPSSVALHAVASAAFPDSGNYIMRSGADFMMIRCARVTFGGISCHCHNDALSFVLQAGGRDFIIDPGTYSYTPYPEVRNAFRSTAAHNVLQVSGQEENDLGDSVFDYRGDRARTRCMEWQSTVHADIFQGEHRGFRRDSDELICTRRIEFKKEKRQWIIDDRLMLPPDGRNMNAKSQRKVSLPRFEWRFHLHPDITVAEQSEPGKIVLENHGTRVQLEAQMERPVFRLDRGWVSFRYGSKGPAQVLSVSSSEQGIDGGRFTLSCL